jgi:hypothetical protein
MLSIQLLVVAATDWMPPSVEAEGLGNCAAGNVPLVIFVALVASVEQLAAAFERSPQAGWSQLGAADTEPVPVCDKNFFVLVICPASACHAGVELA